MMKKFLMLGAVLAVTGCDGLLDLNPVDAIAEDDAITTASDARAALAGAYASLTSGSYYGGTFVFFGDLAADNAVHTGTLQSYAEADRNEFRADNGSVDGIWASIYSGIARANVVLERVPLVDGLRDQERDQILGQAHFLRALHYHNLVRLFGGVPLVLEPVRDVEAASLVTRATESDVYTQILDDLDEAARLLGISDDPTVAGDGAVLALRSRVLLDLDDFAGAESAAEDVVGMGYELAEAYGDLFVDNDTPEDVFKVVFTPVDYHNIGYYYVGGSCGGGRGEVAPSQDLVDAYEAGDARLDWTILEAGADICGPKYPTTLGAEDVHVIRFAEVLLNLAAAQAQQNQLADAVDTYNLVRVRAGLDPHTLGVEVSTQADVLAAIRQERRVELALEGDRWTDLIRTGRAAAVLGIDADQLLLPIPQSELDVAPNLEQNPGY